MMPHKIEMWTFAMAVFCFLPGCFDDSNMATVSGTITVDGNPVDRGSIAFITVDGMAPMTGAEISDGKYSCEVPLTETKVEIRVPTVVGKKKLYDTPDSPEQEVLAELLPGKFNEKTELRYTAESGKQEKNWELLTK